MADKRISEFLDGGLVETGDEIAAVRGGDNYKVRVGSAAAYDAGQSGGELVILEEDSSGTVMLPAVSGEQLTGLSVSDPTVQVSADDTTSGYLEDKITGSATITVTKETDSSGAESLRLDAVGGGGVVEIADGGTGADNAEDARDNLGLDYATIIATPTIIGLTLSNNSTDAANDMDIAVGACWSSDQTTRMNLTSALTKQTDAPFAEGNNAGAMLNGDTMPVGTGFLNWWVITKADGTTDIGCTNEDETGMGLTVGDLPTGFTKLRYLFSWPVASGALDAGTQRGNIFTRTASIQTYGATPAAVPTNTNVPLGVPSIFCAAHIISTFTGGSGERSRAKIVTKLSTTPDASTIFANTGGISQSAASVSGGGGDHMIFATDGEAWANRAAADSGGTLHVQSIGWADLRRKVFA